MSVNEGDVLAGKYRVDKVLGIGGMGVVVAAHHIQLDDKVAIKFMLPEALGNGEAGGETERAIGLLETPITGLSVHGNGNLTATEHHADQNTAS
jgi:serine/threonine protein kinase